MIAWESKFFIQLTSQINLEWIKASPIDMDLFYKKKTNLITFGALITAWTSRKKNLRLHTFFSKALAKKIIIPA